MNVDTLLLVGAAICFLLGAIGVAAGRINVIAVGLLLWVLTELVG